MSKGQYLHKLIQLVNWLIVKKFLKGYKGLELRGSVYNLFYKVFANKR